MNIRDQLEIGDNLMKSICTTTRKSLLVAGACLACGLLTAEALAAEAGPLPITKLRTGWASDTFSIETNRAIINPAGCVSPDGYMSDSSHPGCKTHYAATLMAFSTAKSVTVIVSDTECFSGRPKIQGISVAQ
ncbi:MAG: hypothetical protein HC889_17955 [Synechococcaceae cyanobacterium SM1_2_3]|nr:hypothetical protein [Synechococcaceae cyanobacterium SM1_2_3]